MRHEVTSTHLFGGGLLGGGLLWRKLDLAGWALGKAEDTLLGTVSNGTVELRSLETSHLDLVGLLDKLQDKVNNRQRTAIAQIRTFLIVARDTPVRTSSRWAAMHS